MSIISNDISKAAELLTKGELVAIPTETVYGLAGNIYDEQAIAKIFQVKQRPLFNPLIIHLHSIEQVEEITSDFLPKAKLLAAHFWPGPLTLILKKKANIPNIITAGKDTVAVRIPNHPVTLKLLEKLSFPLAAPSANPFNRISPTKSSHVEAYFKDDISMVLEGGQCNRGIESTIIGFEGDKVIVYRLGSLELEAIEKIVGKIKIKNKSEASPSAPGMLAKHYAPKTKLILVNNIEEIFANYDNLSIGIIRFTGDTKFKNTTKIEVLSESGDLKEAASKLYGTLHKLDHLKLDLIIAERFPNHGLGKTINDRLERATK